MLIAGLVTLPGIGLMLWANFVMTEVDDQMSSYGKNNTINQDRDEPSQAIKAFIMKAEMQHRPHPPAHGEPDQFEPGSFPVEPDEGPVPPAIPDDPEHHPQPAK